MHSSIPSYCVCYMGCRKVGCSVAFSHTLHITTSSLTILFHALSHCPLQTVFSPCTVSLHLTYILHFSLPFGIPPAMPHFSFLDFTRIQVKYTRIWSRDLYTRESMWCLSFWVTSFSIVSSSIHLLANFIIIIILLLINTLFICITFVKRSWIEVVGINRQHWSQMTYIVF